MNQSFHEAQAKTFEVPGTWWNQVGYLPSAAGNLNLPFSGSKGLALSSKGAGICFMGIIFWYGGKDPWSPAKFSWKNYPLTPRLLGEHPGFCQDRRLDTFGFQTGDEQTVVRLAGALVKQDGFAMICSFRGPVCHEMYWEIWLSPALTCPPQTFPGTFPPQRNKSKEQASEKAVASRLSLHSIHTTAPQGEKTWPSAHRVKRNGKAGSGRIRDPWALEDPRGSCRNCKRSAWEMVVMSGFIFSHHYHPAAPGLSCQVWTTQATRVKTIGRPRRPMPNRIAWRLGQRTPACLLQPRFVNMLVLIRPEPSPNEFFFLLLALGN